MLSSSPSVIFLSCVFHWTWMHVCVCVCGRAAGMSTERFLLNWTPLDCSGNLFRCTTEALSLKADSAVNQSVNHELLARAGSSLQTEQITQHLSSYVTTHKQPFSRPLSRQMHPSTRHVEKKTHKVTESCMQTRSSCGRAHAINNVCWLCSNQTPDMRSANVHNGC